VNIPHYFIDLEALFAVTLLMCEFHTSGKRVIFKAGVSSGFEITVSDKRKAHEVFDNMCLGWYKGALKL